MLPLAGKEFKNPPSQLLAVYQSEESSTEHFVTSGYVPIHSISGGAQWLNGRVLDSRPRGRGFEPLWRCCIIVLEQDTFILA